MAKGRLWQQQMEEVKYGADGEYEEAMFGIHFKFACQWFAGTGDDDDGYVGVLELRPSLTLHELLRIHLAKEATAIPCHGTFTWNPTEDPLNGSRTVEFVNGTWDPVSHTLELFAQDLFTSGGMQVQGYDYVIVLTPSCTTGTGRTVKIESETRVWRNALRCEALERAQRETPESIAQRNLVKQMHLWRATL